MATNVLFSIIHSFQTLKRSQVFEISRNLAQNPVHGVYQITDKTQQQAAITNETASTPTVIGFR